MHIRRTPVWVSHVAAEDDVFSVSADGGVRLRPIALHAARASMSQTIDAGAIDFRSHDFIFIELPIAGRYRSVV